MMRQRGKRESGIEGMIESGSLEDRLRLRLRQRERSMISLFGEGRPLYWYIFWRMCGGRERKWLFF
jgi:hypothetical protein